MEKKRIINTSSDSLDLTRTYGQKTRLRESAKPNGLWYSIDDDWVKWCKSEMPEWVKEKNINIDLDLSNIIILNTMDDLRNFKREFSVGLGYARAIDWNKVANTYKGIEIPSIYQFKNKVDDIWIYSWDVDSGCVWDLSAIKSYEVFDCGAYDKEEVEKAKKRSEEDRMEFEKLFKK